MRLRSGFVRFRIAAGTLPVLTLQAGPVRDCRSGVFVGATAPSVWRRRRSVADDFGNRGASGDLAEDLPS
jgi:hypothetical protein